MGEKLDGFKRMKPSKYTLFEIITESTEKLQQRIRFCMKNCYGCDCCCCRMFEREEKNTHRTNTASNHFHFPCFAVSILSQSFFSVEPNVTYTSPKKEIFIYEWAHTTHEWILWSFGLQPLVFMLLPNFFHQNWFILISPHTERKRMRTKKNRNESKNGSWNMYTCTHREIEKSQT